uniref:Uncharacterized protein n=1 Tax=Anguilla anguilla TaxID=7936 RepID=A0A0E9WTT6_ANGAN
MRQSSYKHQNASSGWSDKNAEVMIHIITVKHKVYFRRKMFLHSQLPCIWDRG